MKNLTKKQKQLFVDGADNGFECLDPDDFAGTEVGALLKHWHDANDSLDELFREYSEELE